MRHGSLTPTTQTKRSVYIRWYLCGGPSSSGISPDLSGVNACCEQRYDVPGQAVELWRLTGHDWQAQGLKLIPSSPGVFRPQIQTGPGSPPKVASSLPQGAKGIISSLPVSIHLLRSYICFGLWTFQNCFKSPARGSVVWILGVIWGPLRMSGVGRKGGTSVCSQRWWWWPRSRPDLGLIQTNAAARWNFQWSPFPQPAPPPFKKQPSFTSQFCIHTREIILFFKNNFAAAMSSSISTC